MLDSHDLSLLTTHLFATAMGHASWEDFLGKLSQKSGDICVHMFGYDLEAGLSIDLAAHGYAPEHINTYMDYYANLNAWAPGFVAHDAGRVVDCEQMCTSSQLFKTEFYQDWLRPQEDIAQGGGALLFKNETRVFALGGNIRVKDADKLKNSWLSSVNQLIPHLQQAFEVKRLLAGGNLESVLIAREDLRFVPGIVVLSPAGRVIFSNPVAHEMLERGSPISKDILGRVYYRDSGASRVANIDSFKDRVKSEERSFIFKYKPEFEEIFYDFRFFKFDPRVETDLTFGNCLGITDHCTILMISETPKNDNLEDRIQKLGGLTAAEVSVSILLLKGLSIKEISEAREVSQHTVRTQVKSIMSKLSVKRQAELVLMLQKL